MPLAYGVPQLQPSTPAQALQTDAEKGEALRQWQQQQLHQRQAQGEAHDGLRNQAAQQQQVGYLQTQQHQDKAAAQRDWLQQQQLKLNSIEQQGQRWAQEEQGRHEATQCWMQEQQQREQAKQQAQQRHVQEQQTHGQAKQQAQQRHVQEQQTHAQEKQLQQQSAAFASGHLQQQATQQADEDRSQSDQARLHAQQAWAQQQKQEAVERAQKHDWQLRQEPDKAQLEQKAADQSQLRAQLQWQNQQRQLARHVGDAGTHHNSWSPQGTGIRTTTKTGLVSPQSQHAVQAYGMSKWQHNKTLARSLGPVGSPTTGLQHDSPPIADAMANAQQRHKHMACPNLVFPAAPTWQLTA